MVKSKAVINCQYIGITTKHGGQRLECRVSNDPDHIVTITSQLKMIDFERKLAVTQNNIYQWS